MPAPRLSIPGHRQGSLRVPLGAVACSHVVSHVQPHELLFESQLYVCLLHADLSSSHLICIAILRGPCY